MRSSRTGYIARGHFGDGNVRVFVSEPAGISHKAPLVVLLHGVHGCADMSFENKYGHLSRMLDFRGVVSALVETSRLRRDRHAFGEDRESWAWAAFRGKTFADDHADVLEGVRLAHTLFPEKDLWIWGFSLGGIHAVAAAGKSSKAILHFAEIDAPLTEFKPRGIITSGSGYRVRPEAKRSLALPILDSMPSEKLLHDAARKLSADFFISFYGTLDGTFSEESCRKIVKDVPLPEERKLFHIIDGADHPFRKLYGHTSLEPLGMMTDTLAPLLYPWPPGFQTEIPQQKRAGNDGAKPAEGQKGNQG